MLCVISGSELFSNRRHQVTENWKLKMDSNSNTLQIKYYKILNQNSDSFELP